jgi:hypothetical protein
VTRQGNPLDSIAPLVTPAKCCKCGCSTPDSKMFARTHKSFSNKVLYLCPTCIQKRAAKRNHATLIMYGAHGVAAVALLCFEPTRRFGWFAFNLFLLFVCEVVSILLHEAAHVAVARSLGWKVFRVRIGTGKTIFEKEIAGAPWQINAAPFGGITFLAPVDERGMRWKFLVIVSAGLPVHIAFIAIGFISGASWLGWLPPAIFDGPQWPSLLLVINVAYLILNVIRSRAHTAGYMVNTDGMLIWRGIFEFALLREPLLMARYVLGANELRHRKKFAEAHELLSAAMDRFDATNRFSNDLSIATHYGIVLLDLKRFAEAGDVFRELLNKSNLDDPNKGILLNNIAWVDLLTGDPNLLPEADQYSAEAMSKLEWAPSVRGTRGCVLIELGRVDEGLTLVSSAMQTHVDADKKALNACYLVIGYARKGDLNEAKRYRDIAETLDRDCMLLPRADAELANPRTAILNSAI